VEAAAETVVPVVVARSFSKNHSCGRRDAATASSG
jgi:hypothetical protein